MATNYLNYLRSAFIKVDNNHVVPIIENDWDFDTYWVNLKYFSKNKTIVAVDEIYKKIVWINDDLKSKYNDYDNDSFWFFYKIKINNKKVTFRQFKNYFKKSIKNALTIEEYKGLGIRFCIDTIGIERTEAKRLGIVPLDLKIITSTEELKRLTKLFEEYYNETNIEFLVKPYFSDMGVLLN